MLCFQATLPSKLFLHRRDDHAGNVLTRCCFYAFQPGRRVHFKQQRPFLRTTWLEAVKLAPSMKDDFYSILSVGDPCAAIDRLMEPIEAPAKLRAALSDGTSMSSPARPMMAWASCPARW